MWLSASALGGGAVLMIGNGPGVTLPAAAVMGVGGVTLQITTLAVLSDAHPTHRDRAFVEANAGASAAALLAPALIAVLGVIGLGWRLCLLFPVLSLATLYLVFRRQPTGSSRNRPSRRG